MALERVPTPAITDANQWWSMDFVSAAFADGRQFRNLTVLDDASREYIVLEVGRSLSAARVIAALDRVVRLRGSAPSIVCYNGAEFWSDAMDQWAAQHGITLAFIEPGRPVKNAGIESFNGRFRGECLNEQWFLDLAHAKATVEERIIDCSAVRPHGQLGERTPDEYVESARADIISTFLTHQRLTAVLDQHRRLRRSRLTASRMLH